ncbi:MAG: radical SAM protein [Planctomycetota bacterium]|jgi:radical SAM protein with 4Fe4S-binding SPASM domain
MIASAPAAPDLLRLEQFGAVHYQRSTSTTRLYPAPLARLLVAARDRSLLDVFVAEQRAGRMRKQDQVAFAHEVVRLQRDGVLDQGYRVRARLVDGRPHEATLSAPLVTHIQLTNACNLKCTHCYVPVGPHQNPDEMETEEILRLFRELSDIGCPVVVLAGGEPMRRPDFFELIEFLSECHFNTTLCTNATLITRHNAEVLAQSALYGVNVSLDGPDAATHDFLRGEGQFERALKGTRYLIEAGMQEVKLRVTVTAHNADHLLGLASVARDLGVTSVVMKAFDQVGVVSGDEHLAIDRRTYLEKIEPLKEAWPEGAPPLFLSDGMPTRPPSFAPLIPTFGCVGGTTNATIMSNGEVRGCGAVDGEDPWKLRDHTFQECWLDSGEVNRWRALLDNEQCRSCENLTVCGGGCRARAVGVGRGFHEPDPFAECSLYVPAGEPKAPRKTLRPLPMAWDR